MREYPKIDTLFERDEKFKVMPDRLRRPVLASINPWVVTEKVDGTNIRVSMAHGDGKIEVGGRTDKAQIPADLVKHIYDTVTPDKFAGLFLPDTTPGTRITLFGEGYGAGIQKGGHYRADKGFILFDALIECAEHAYWQDDDTVTKFAERLGVPRVPILGEWSLAEIVVRVSRGILSVVAVEAANAEGIVARPREPLFDRNGKRLIIKLKTSDF